MGQPEKTYKREVAGGLLGFWVILVIIGMFYPEAKEAYEFMTLPVFTFAGGAFALDSAFKQREPRQ